MGWYEKVPLYNHQPFFMLIYERRFIARSVETGMNLESSLWNHENQTIRLFFMGSKD